MTQLSRLYLATEQRHLAWKTMGQHFEDDINFEKYIAFSHYTIEDVITSFRYFAAYEKFRSVSPLARYTNILTEEQVSLDEDFEKTLYFVCAITFGLACNILTSYSLDEQKDSLEQVWTSVQNSLVVSFPRIAKKALGNVKTETAEDIAKGLTPIILYWPHFALIEASGQIGYIGTIFGLSVDNLDQEVIFKDMELDNWQQEVRLNTLIEINEVLQCFGN